MEFISNFIRRPMSLVLSESFEQTSTNTSPKSPNPLDHDVTNNNSNVNNNTRPSTNKAGVQIDVGACGDGGASMIGCEQKTCQQFHSSTSSSSTSSTIEELLIQINDNLNQASLQNATDELPFEYLPNQLPTCLLLNPLATKPPSTIKLPQSPHLQPQTAPCSYTVPLSSTLAAGSALPDSSDSKLRIDSELETPRFNETHLVLNNNNNNKSNKFMGLTEFDESKIPELSSHLHTNNSDQIKLTFEEDLIPTLTANSNTKLDLSTRGGSPSKTLQILTYETDTALSSDNETYAECQSFLDLVHTNPAASTRIHLGYGENNTSMSEADTYRSALSIYNNTAVSNALVDEHENLDATMENVDDICDELIEPIGNDQCWQELPALPSHSTKRYSLGNDLMNTTLDGNGDEPMDVSIIQTYDLPQTKHVTMETDCVKDIANKQDQPQSTVDNHENPIAHNRSTSAAVNEASNLSPSALVPESTLLTGSTPTYSSVLPDKSLEKRNPYVNLSIPTIKVSNTTEPRTSLGALANAEPQSRLTFSVVAEPDNLSAGTSTALDSESTKANISTDKCSQISNDEAQASASGINNTAESSLGTLEKAAPQNRSTFSYTKKADNMSPGCIDNTPEPGLDPESIQKREPIAKRRTFTVEGAEQHIVNDVHAFPAGACNVVEPESTLGTLANVSTANRLTFSIKSAEQSNINGIGNSPVEVVTDDSYTKPKNNCNLIQDNNVDSATDITSDPPVEDHEHIVATINSPIADSGNATRIITSTGVAVELGSPYEKILNSSQSSSSALYSEDKMNLTLNGGSSLEIAPSSHTVSVNSLSFPVKPAMHNDNFPRSPEVSKPSTFLEKSDYAANSSLKASSPKKGIECKNDSTCSSIEHNLNETQSMSSSVSSVSTKQNSFSNHQPVAAVAKNSSLSQSLLNGTFNESSLPPPSMSSSTSELHTMRIAKHHTSSVSPNPKSQLENSLNQTRSISPDTFGVPHPAELEACNESLEAMDVDCSMEATSAPQTTLSPKIQENTTSTSETCANPCVNMEMLSAKELTKSNVNDEKDILVERIVSTGSAHKTTTITIGSCSSTTATDSSYKQVEFGNEDFQNNLILNPSDFDYLLTKGNSNVEIDRSSLLLKFDPLLGIPVPVNQPQHYQQVQQPLSPTLEEDEQQNEKNLSLAAGDTNKTASASNQSKPTSAHSEKKSTAQDDFKQCEQKQQQQQQGFLQEHTKTKKNARMSVDVIKDMKIENENCNKTIESSNTQPDEIQNNFRMDELEKKIKNEILKTEDIEKKLKEAEQREEALIKRITDKDKTISKMNGVIEAYEKAIAELISEKEQLIQNYEKQLAEVKADRDSNYHHLNSLETTFSDLHVKYEKSKEMTSQLKSSEESLLAEKKQNLENLRLQEQRYEKMKNHAMQQLEIANKKLECLTKEHAIETTKLKALLKKEEISRASINEQLQQKSRENAELVKICDELINGQGS